MIWKKRGIQIDWIQTHTHTHNMRFGNFGNSHTDVNEFIIII